MKILRARYFLMDSKTKVPPLWPQMMSKLYIKTPNNDLLKGHKKSIITITNPSCHLVTDIFFRQSYPKRCKIRVNIRSSSWMKLKRHNKENLEISAFLRLSTVFCLNFKITDTKISQICEDQITDIYHSRVSSSPSVKQRDP